MLMQNVNKIVSIKIILMRGHEKNPYFEIQYF